MTIQSSESATLESFTVFLKSSAAVVLPIFRLATVYPRILAKDDFPEPKKPETHMPMPSRGRAAPLGKLPVHFDELVAD